MKVRPLGNRVLIKVDEATEKTKGGIYIPETASQEKTQRGKIEAVGADESIKVKVGDEVIYSKYAGDNIKVEEQEYLLISI
jgi:chaperonin GroES